MFGFLNIYKPRGMTSHDVVAVLRRITQIKQIGHTGTLDPFAEGVLPVCIGKATRLIEYMPDNKAYIGTVQLGSSTTTYDIEGEPVNISDKTVTKEEIENALNSFRGEIEQLPPIYSAIKVKGKKLYEYARKGEEVKIESRKVRIDELTVKSYDIKTRRLELYIACSKGTYIRSIANDLGEALGIYGHLVKLVRVKAGNFSIEDSIRLENLKTSEDMNNNLINPVEYLNYPVYKLSTEEFEKVVHGMEINLPNGYLLNNRSEDIKHCLREMPNTGTSENTVMLIYQNKLAAIGMACHGTIKCKKVFI